MNATQLRDHNVLAFAERVVRDAIDDDVYEAEQEAARQWVRDLTDYAWRLEILASQLGLPDGVTGRHPRLIENLFEAGASTHDAIDALIQVEPLPIHPRWRTPADPAPEAPAPGHDPRFDGDAA